jgi:hypothetical protein
MFIQTFILPLHYKTIGLLLDKNLPFLKSNLEI